MQFNVLVEQHNQTFTATVAGLPECRAEAQTKEVAVAQVTALLKSWIMEGKLVTVEIEQTADGKVLTGNPWLASAGAFKDDPTYDEFLENIAAYRRELDAEEAAREAAQSAAQ